MRVGKWIVVLSLVCGASSAFADPSEGCVDSTPSPLEGMRAVVKPLNPKCKADKYSKTYPGPNGAKGTRTWYLRREVEVQCNYVCESDNLPTVTIKGTRTVKFFEEAGYELACYAVPYKSQFSAFTMTEVYMDQEPQRFYPAKSDVREVVKWANGE